MIKSSACILTKNEEKNIERCLENIKDVVYEIIIIDAQSTDKTVKICKKYTNKIYKRTFSGSFAEERNYAISKATGEWILMIDADETLSDELKKNVRKLVSTKKISGYWIPRIKLIGGKYLRHGLAYPDYQLRLFRKNKARYQGIVHEIPVIKGETEHIKFNIVHHSEKFLPKEEISVQLAYAKLDAKRTPFSRTVLSIPYVVYCYFVKKGFMDGWLGVKYHLYKIWYYALVLKYWIDLRFGHS